MVFRYLVVLFGVPRFIRFSIDKTVPPESLTETCNTISKIIIFVVIKPHNLANN